jgi:hypothetical protein
VVLARRNCRCVTSLICSGANTSHFFGVVLAHLWHHYATAFLVAKTLKNAVEQCRGRFFAPCARSVSADGGNQANATLHNSAILRPMRVALAQKMRKAITLR